MSRGRDDERGAPGLLFRGRRRPVRHHHGAGGRSRRALPSSCSRAAAPHRPPTATGSRCESRAASPPSATTRCGSTTTASARAAESSRAIRLDRPFVDDVLAGVRCLQEHGVREIALAGTCFGARTALASADRIPGLRGVALLAAPVSDGGWSGDRSDAHLALPEARLQRARAARARRRSPPSPVPAHCPHEAARGPAVEPPPASRSTARSRGRRQPPLLRSARQACRRRDSGAARVRDGGRMSTARSARRGRSWPRCLTRRARGSRSASYPVGPAVSAGSRCKTRSRACSRSGSCGLGSRTRHRAA